MEVRTGKSIWDDMPSAWGTEIDHNSDNIDQKSEPEESTGTHPSSDIPVTVETQNETEEPGKKQKKQVISRGLSKRAKKKIEKKKYAEFVKKSKESKLNSSDHVKKAYEEEEEGNEHDYKILGILVALVIIGLIVLVLVISKISTQHIYDLIHQGNYSTAYLEIEELHHKDKNVDALVYAFAEDCARHSEYKRAVASLELLSSDAEKNKEFFENLIDIMLSHRKVNRAYEVLDYMQSHGEILNQYAIEIYEKNKDRFQRGE